MNLVTSEYRRKLRTAEEAVQVVQNGDSIWHGGNSAFPFALARALAERARELDNLTVTHMLVNGENPLSHPDLAGRVKHRALFVGAGDRAGVAEGRIEYVPIALHQIPRLFRDRLSSLDVALVTVSPPDEHGYMSFGVETMANAAACDAARVVICQVNSEMPRVLGDSFIHVREATYIVEHDEPLPGLTPRVISPVERAIGRYIREMISDGATIQMGIGGIPDAVYESLDGLRDLGIHTEMVSDGAMRAIERGIVTGERKSLNPGKVVHTFALGSVDLYRYMNNNPLFEARPCDYTNDPRIIALNDNLVAINAALEIDLTGQVVADSIGRRIYSGVGGQPDFIRGATRSKGGLPIIALPATASGGKVSRIVPLLKPGAGVVTTRADVHTVVTEYGVARLFGKTLRERAEALISVSHPDFREELSRASRDAVVVARS